MSRQVKISKFLSYHLRHRPDLLGLELASGGWVEVNKLLVAAKKSGFSFTLAELKQVVAENDKQRFSFNNKGDLIRANQGHSVQVDLELDVAVPPDILYHGTYQKVVAQIKKQGLKKMQRHHVHLSADLQTAIRVGARRGYPVIFQVDALAMCNAGHTFYCSENQIWLTEVVPACYLKLLSSNLKNR